MSRRFCSSILAQTKLQTLSRHSIKFFNDMYILLLGSLTWNQNLSLFDSVGKYMWQDIILLQFTKTWPGYTNRTLENNFSLFLTSDEDSFKYLTNWGDILGMFYTYKECCSRMSVCVTPSARQMKNTTQHNLGRQVCNFWHVGEKPCCPMQWTLFISHVLKSSTLEFCNPP